MADPLVFLANARRVHGNLFGIDSEGPIFSRSADCSGVVFAFGAALQRQVLTDIGSFAMPPSAVRSLGLPDDLANLNRSLHSMGVEEHAVHKSLLSGSLNARATEHLQDLAWRALADSVTHWQPGGTFGLFSQLREVLFRTASRVMFGDDYIQYGELASKLQTYFLLRREVSSPAGSRANEDLERLVTLGHSLGIALQSYVRACSLKPGATQRGIFARLADLTSGPNARLSAEEAIGHMNVLFISSTEPLSVALTWTLLILSQLPTLRSQLREEMRSIQGSTPPTTEELDRLVLLECVISESLRLLPPNAFMVRLTSRPVLLGETPLPAECEVILSPFIAHRNSDIFDQPDHFLPDRWRKSQPSPFDYFPFGAGGHACVGRSLALRLMKTTLVFLISRYDILLASDQEVDWRLHIQFMPSSDPTIVVHHVEDGANHEPGGRLIGPVRDLVILPNNL